MKVLRRGDEGTEVFEPGRRAKSPVGEAQRFACDDRLHPRQSWIDLLLRWQGSQVADEVVERLAHSLPQFKPDLDFGSNRVQQNPMRLGLLHGGVRVRVRQSHLRMEH